MYTTTATEIEMKQIVFLLVLFASASAHAFPNSGSVFLGDHLVEIGSGDTGMNHYFQ